MHIQYKLHGTIITLVPIIFSRIWRAHWKSAWICFY